jgi:hypothetical protein
MDHLVKPGGNDRGGISWTAILIPSGLHRYET